MVGRKRLAARYDGNTILVENTWFCGMKLSIGGVQVHHNRDLLALRGTEPVIRCIHPFPGGSREVGIFCQAILTTKIQIHIDGELLAGELF